MNRRVRGLVILAAVPVLLLAACTPSMTVYRVGDSSIDGVLWRLIASVEDPLDGVYGSTATPDAEAYFAAMRIARWEEGSEPVPELGQPVVVAYDVVDAGDRVSFAAFLSSGMRPDVPTDRGQPYSGPDSVFTCYVLTVTFGAYGMHEIHLTSESSKPEDCPADLVANMPGVTSYAEPGVFAG